MVNMGIKTSWSCDISHSESNILAHMKQFLAGRRIFIVEDNPSVLYAFTASVTRSGASVDQNALGYDIVDHLSGCLPIDLIILDIKLRKGINGYDLYEKIRTNPKLRHIPVVIVTSLDPETEIPKAKSRRVNGFISKPVSMRELPIYLAKVLNGEEVWISHEPPLDNL